MTLGIFGCGGLGKEFLMLAQEINKATERWDEIIFIVDTVTANTVKNTKVISLSDAIDKFDKQEFEIVIAIGEPAVREEKYMTLKKHGISLATLIHPSVCISDCTTIGEGSVICFGCFISCDVSIGCNTVIMPNANIGHDCIVGGHSIVCSFASFGGTIVVGDKAFIGMSSSIIQGAKIGKNAIVSMGSCVMRDVPDETVVMGNPARVIAKNAAHSVFSR